MKAERVSVYTGHDIYFDKSRLDFYTKVKNREIRAGSVSYLETKIGKEYKRLENKDRKKLNVEKALEKALPRLYYRGETDFGYDFFLKVKSYCVDGIYLDIVFVETTIPNSYLIKERIRLSAIHNYLFLLEADEVKAINETTLSIEKVIEKLERQLKGVSEKSFSVEELL